MLLSTQFLITIISCRIGISRCSDTVDDHHIRIGDLEANDTRSLALYDTNHFIVSRSLTWPDAQLACSYFCSRLAVLETEKDAQQLSRALNKVSIIAKNLMSVDTKHGHEFDVDRGYWIGLKDNGFLKAWVWQPEMDLLNYTFWNDVELSKTHAVEEQCASVLSTDVDSPEKYRGFTVDACANEYYAICDLPNGKTRQRTEPHCPSVNSG